jgi:hypothetical protein
MQLKITFKFIVPFLALTFVMHEAHEIVHTVIARIICGCWGPRDFNVWGACEGCAISHPFSLFATFAGPIFTFCMIWIGAGYLKDSNTDEQKSFGFALLFANMPFGRILSVAIGGGDEVWGLNQLLQNHGLSWAIGLLIEFVVLFIPLRNAFKIITNKKKIGIFLLFFLVPIIVDLLVVLGLMNSLLSKGLLDKPGIIGSPVLVNIWTAFVLIIFIITRKNIFFLCSKEN